MQREVALCLRGLFAPSMICALAIVGVLYIVRVFVRVGFAKILGIGGCKIGCTACP